LHRDLRLIGTVFLDNGVLLETIWSACDHFLGRRTFSLETLS